ncbi:hypothetical protein ACI2S5_08415 [Ralstonia nicotianae]|uniref:hypothetical protein n=1 Tax=Ralstonia pseudosolanacearum TaxID=1310165 RepID=UPI0008F8CB5B|nr:hypothetical protein [Ralstonia pseudosolanacearum]AXW48147.1 hypothetical protein CJO91_10800 [Ralstonia solanacearum]KAF3461393.1 hypothetical protein GO278_001962 [Ralstonia solanacearum]NKA06898.1 hypothetical protein [Ralstonia solanacearum]NKA78874.1 hypothetical protein [Ralstonia solanacearum]NKF99207.1 hypothetical protein [Ralstonia solanacearum]
MSRRCHHRGRPARETGALPSVIRFSRGAEVQLQLVPHVELEKLRDGTATEESWHTLAFRINVGQVLAQQYFAHVGDVLDAMARGVVAVAEVGKRFRRVGRFGCTGDEFRAIGAALTLTDDMQEATTRRQQLHATQTVYALATQRGAAAAGELLPTRHA